MPETFTRTIKIPKLAAEITIDFSDRFSWRAKINDGSWIRERPRHSRPVFIFENDFVLKTGHIQQCNNEIEFWRKNKTKKYASLLAPIIDCRLDNKEPTNSWLITPYYKSKKGKISQKNKDLVQNAIESLGITKDIETKSYVHNWLVDEATGLPIIFDYGIPEDYKYD